VVSNSPGGMDVYLCVSVCVFLCYVVLCAQRPLRRAHHSSRGVLLRVLIRSRNFRCEAAEFFPRTVQPLMMTMMIISVTIKLYGKNTL
jgi:hypothetical protein